MQIFCNLVDDYKKNKWARRNCRSCYRKQKELYIPRQKYMKTKWELEKEIVETQRNYKDIIFGNDIPICKECLNELKKLQIIDERSHNQKLMESTIIKLAWDTLRISIVMGQTRKQANFWVLKLIKFITKRNSRSIF